MTGHHKGITYLRAAKLTDRSLAFSLSDSPTHDKNKELCVIPTQLFDLTGKVALLTGASKGMGRAMAIALAEHGARVMISSRKLDACQRVADEINAACGEKRAHAFACNAGYKDQLQALVDSSGRSTFWWATQASIPTTGVRSTFPTRPGTRRWPPTSSRICGW
jgi:hypothetical protein